MLPQILDALLTYGVGIGIVALFALLVVLLAIQQRRLRVWKRAHRLVSADYRTMRDRFFALQGQYGALLDDVEGETLHAPDPAEAEAEAEAVQA